MILIFLCNLYGKRTAFDSGARLHSGQIAPMMAGDIVPRDEFEELAEFEDGNVWFNLKGEVFIQHNNDIVALTDSEFLQIRDYLDSSLEIARSVEVRDVKIRRRRNALSYQDGLITDRLLARHEREEAETEEQHPQTGEKYDCE